MERERGGLPVPELLSELLLQRVILTRRRAFIVNDATQKVSSWYFSVYITDSPAVILEERDGLRGENYLYFPPPACIAFELFR